MRNLSIPKFVNNFILICSLIFTFSSNGFAQENIPLSEMKASELYNHAINKIIGEGGSKLALNKYVNELISRAEKRDLPATFFFNKYRYFLCKKTDEFNLSMPDGGVQFCIDGTQSLINLALDPDVKNSAFGVNSMITLGMIYSDGIPGIEKSKERSIFWYKTAAKQSEYNGDYEVALRLTSYCIQLAPENKFFQHLKSRIEEELGRSS